MYALIAGTIGLAIDAFYRRVSLGGAVPASGAVLLVANHPNGLIDPVVVSNAAGRPIRMLAKAPLFKMPVLSLLVKGVGALPVYRAKDGADTGQNAATFRAVVEALADGSAVLIFPEGISHDEPQLQRLKTGAARMALQAAQAGVELSIVPVGLTYRDKERFRSEVATLVGEPLRVEPATAALDGASAEAAAGADAEAARALTDRIAEALAKVTVNLEEWEDLPLLEAVDAIWRIDDPNRTSRIKQLADGVRLLRAHAPERLLAIRARVVEWTQRLRGLGLTPHDLSLEHVAARTDGAKAALFAVRNLVVALVGLPVALFGAVFFAVPFWLGHALYLIGRPERDVAATVKVLSAMVLFPLWHVVATAVLWRLASPPVALAVAALAPLCGMTTRWFFRGRKRALRDVAVFFRLAFKKRLNARLERERDELVADIDALGKLVEELRAPVHP